MSWLLLVSGRLNKVNERKGESNKSKSRGLVLLSTAAKLWVVAGRDLQYTDNVTVINRCGSGDYLKKQVFIINFFKRLILA